MSISVLGFNKRFERMAQVNKDQSMTIGNLTHRLEAMEAHHAYFMTRMDVIDERLDEHEKRWMNWESSDPRITPCYRDKAHNDLCSDKQRTIIEETEDSSDEQQHPNNGAKLYGGGPSRNIASGGATAVDPGSSHSNSLGFR